MWFQNSGLDNDAVVLSPGRLASGKVVVESPHNELFLRSIRVTSLRVGESIFRRGDNVEGLYLLKTGVVKLTSKCAVIRGRTTSEDYISKLIGAGDFFGYQDFFLNGQHQQEARAIKPSEVLLYPKELVQRLMATGGSLASQIMSQMAKQMVAEDERVKYQYLASVGERISHTLVDLAHRFGEKTPAGVLLRLKLTRGELAQLAGTINESLSRHLSEMKDENILEVRGKEILIKDMARLMQRSGRD
jgi:CRP-like cAMP-binding protein